MTKDDEARNEDGRSSSFAMESNGIRERSSRTIPERISQGFYAIGFFCSSYPFTIIFLSISIALLSCYPLLSVPLPGNKPQEYVTHYENYSIPSFNPFGNEENLPRWYKNYKGIFVQQILVRSSVAPWHPNLIVTDAFRGPLSESFKLLEVIKTSHLSNESNSLQRLCFHVEDVKSKVLKGKNSMLPEFNCLILSPTHFWQGSHTKFQDDPDILGTVLNYEINQKGKSGLAEILLGLHVKDTGLKRYPFKTRQRIISYAITIFFENFDPRFISKLKSDLLKLYPANSGLDRPNGTEIGGRGQIFHIFYPSQSSLVQLVPLIVTYVAMFIYFYFSVKKVEMVKSKLGMAFSALTTVVASLCMSVGICCHFGVIYEVNAKAIFPYLVVIIGLENILVLMRSVVSTSAHLDIKIRVAQGLSKEGFNITKNLLAEVTILTIGFFTFIPVIQEFCILAVVGLFTDFFLQTFFFATVLSVDIRRAKLSVDPKQHTRFAPLRIPLHPPRRPLGRVKSNPGLSNGTIPNQTANGVSVVAPSQANPILVKIPKRLRLVSLWARTRFFQRTFIIFMIAWISFIIYDSGIVSHFNDEMEDLVIPLQRMNQTPGGGRISLALSQSSRRSYVVNRTLLQKGKTGIEKAGRDDDSTYANDVNDPRNVPNPNMRLRNELYDYQCNPHTWRRLSPYHWQVLLGIYNMSMSGKYISILPPICISIPVDPNVAFGLRHHQENEQAKKFNWQALANEPVDLLDDYDHTPMTSTKGKGGKSIFYSFSAWEDPYIPRSPVELGLAVLFAVPSVLFISYMLVTFYKCVCSRNYAEWRSNWSGNSENSQDFYTQVVFEAVPLVLDGHTQEVECMGSDGNIVASVCLDGILKLWNATTGDNTLTIDRRRYFKQLAALNDNDDQNSDADSLTAGSSPPGAGIEEYYRPEYEPLEGQALNRNERRRSQNHYSSQGDNRPASPTSSSTNFKNWPPLSPQTHHPKNSSMSCSFSTGNVVPSSVPISVQQHSGYENNFSSNHRRTSSFPNQVPPYQNNLSHSPPIPTLSHPRCEVDNESIPSSGNPVTYSNINGYAANSSDFVHNNSNGSGACALNDNSTDGTTQFRVGSPTSPLEKILEKGVEESSPHSPVWCLDCQENIIVLGTGSGRIELWDAFMGFLKCTYEDDYAPGVVHVRISGNRIVAARINGSLDFLEVESSLNCQAGDSPSLYHRWQGFPAEGSGSRSSMYSLESEIRCVWLASLKAHQQPITCLDLEGGRVLTGSQDHSLKVFRLEDHMPLYTLHGHYGPITCLFIDKVSPMTSGSASQDGMLCVWDLMTGMCMYSIQAHDGPVSALTYSVSYIISAGGDDKICVWERFQGHLLSTIQLDHAYCSSLVMLTHNLLVTSKQGSLVVWDVRNGAPVRAVRLGHRDNTVFVRQIMGCNDSILCDYGSQLRLIRFPSVVNKVD